MAHMCPQWKSVPHDAPVLWNVSMFLWRYPTDNLERDNMRRRPPYWYRDLINLGIRSICSWIVVCSMWIYWSGVRILWNEFWIVFSRKLKPELHSTLIATETKLLFLCIVSLVQYIHNSPPESTTPDLWICIERFT